MSNEQKIENLLNNVNGRLFVWFSCHNLLSTTMHDAFFTHLIFNPTGQLEIGFRAKLIERILVFSRLSVFDKLKWMRVKQNSYLVRKTATLYPDFKDKMEKWKNGEISDVDFLPFVQKYIPSKVTC